MMSDSNLSKLINEKPLKQNNPLAVDGRIKAIDQLRGFSIMLMVVLNFGATVQSVPTWLKHVPDIGLNFADLGSPVFIFTIGLTYSLSFSRRRSRDGLFATYGHFIRRYLAILGIGAIFSAGESFLELNDSGVDWGVLQTIGCCGLLTLMVIQLPTGIRLAVGLGLITTYQVLLDKFWLDRVINSPQGGLAGTIGWSVILIIATVFADIFHNKDLRKYFLILSLLFLVAGIVLAQFVPISKVRVSAPYDLVTLGFCSIVFSVFYLTNYDLKYFSAWGKNPILLYFLSLLLTGLFVLPDVPGWHAQAPLWLAGLQAAGLVVLLGLLAVYWQKRGFRFSI